MTLWKFILHINLFFYPLVYKYHWTRVKTVPLWCSIKGSYPTLFHPRLKNSFEVSNLGSYVGNFIIMRGLRCWWQSHWQDIACRWLCPKSVINISNLSPTWAHFNFDEANFWYSYFGLDAIIEFWSEFSRCLKI